VPRQATAAAVAHPVGLVRLKTHFYNVMLNDLYQSAERMTHSNVMARPVRAIALNIVLMQMARSGMTRVGPRTSRSLRQLA
jgi:hypothetical protein